MITRFLTTWDSVRTSLWALPLLIVCGGCGLAYIALSVGNAGPSIWVLFGGSSQQAPSFLSSLMTAMINMATLAVSITMVVLALAAQQLGPRLIRSFMSDRRTQVALGLFIGTVVYLVLVLRAAYGDGKSVPALAVTGGTLLVLLSFVTLLLFVHHLANSIVADSVIARVGDQFDRDILRLCSERNDDPPAPDLGRDCAPVLLRDGGYVQAVDYATIARAAAKAGAIVALEIRAGHHAVAGVVAASVSPSAAAENDDLRRSIQSAILVGAQRTTVQDLEFSARHLVEVALRALSPGINDVYTALAVIDRLTVSLRTMMKRARPQNVWKDADGHIRVIAPVSTFAGVVDAAFNQIRQSSASKPAVLIRMAESIGQLLQQASDEQRPVLEKHLQLVLSEGRRSIPETQDLADLEARVRGASDQTGRANPGRHART